MSIWFKEYNLDDFLVMKQGTMMEALDMELTEMGADYLAGKMPINEKTVQPMKILHGGASVALAETLGSMASFMIIDPSEKICVGQSITANHIRPGLKGYLHGKAQIIHKGKSSHIWNIDLTNDEGKLVCTCRLTMAILPKPKK